MWHDVACRVCDVTRLYAVCDLRHTTRNVVSHSAGGKSGEVGLILTTHKLSAPLSTTGAIKCFFLLRRILETKTKKIGMIARHVSFFMYKYFF